MWVCARQVSVSPAGESVCPAGVAVSPAGVSGHRGCLHALVTRPDSRRGRSLVTAGSRVSSGAVAVAVDRML